MSKHFYLLLLLLFPICMFAQVQNAAIPKDAPVDVSMTDFKGKILNNEIVVFRSQLNSKEYQGLTDDKGKFSIRLPSGDKYEIFVLGFKDSTSLNVLEIPALKGNAYYKDPFTVELQHLPSKSFVLDNCNFESGKSILLPEAYPVLDELVEYLNRKDDDRIELGGHTDNVGGAAKNLQLSLDRALAVRQYLIEKGIDPNRLMSKGYGLTKPIVSNATAAGRAQNRRTEVTILE
ncbi:MAG: OmpA family protein [Chitinophagaceae bacterium]